MRINDYIEITNEDNMELMKRYPDNYFDLAVVDPPYGIGAENHAGNSENGWKQWDKKEWDSTIPDESYFNELFRVSKNQIVWGGNYMTKYLKPSMCWLIWDKGQRNFSLADGEMAWTSFNKAMRIFGYARAKMLSETKIHPTQKPVALYEWIFTKFAKENDKILDTHGGSLNIALALDNVNKIDKMNLTLTACELDKDYFKTSTNNIIAKTTWQSLF